MSMMNITKIMPPHPREIVKSFATTIPNSNIYLMAHPRKLEFSRDNWGTYIQFILILVHTALLTGYFQMVKNQKERKPFIKKPKADTYIEILKQNSRIIQLFLETNTPLILKIDYLIHYASIIFGVNAIFYKEPEIHDLSDYILKNFNRSMIGLAIGIILMGFTCKFLDAYEDGKLNLEQIKKSILIYFQISMTLMIISAYLCSIFCYEFKGMQDNWFWGGLQGFCLTFSYRFFLPYGFHTIRKILVKFKVLPPEVTSEEVEDSNKKMV